MNDYKSSIRQIKDRLNLVNMFEKEGISVQTAGIGKYKCLCPFHGEKTPSMIIYEDTQTYHCFGCGASGDAITFFEEKHALNFKESLLELSKITGVEIEQSNSETLNLTKYLEIIRIVNEEFKRVYKNLDDKHIARENIRSRNLDPYEDWYGYAPKDNRYIKQMLIKKGFTEEDLINAGIVNQNGNIFFFDRLIFTINNYMNRPIAFSARRLNNNEKYGKYINSPASEVFDKSSSFFNIEKAKQMIKKENKVYIVEGQFDVIAMYNNGYQNTLAACGTAITEKHIRTLMNLLDNGNIVFIMDGDNAGIHSMINVFKKYPEIHTNAKVVVMPKGLDPCDYFKTNKMLPEERSLLDWIYTNLKSKLRGKSPEELVNLSNKAYEGFSNYIKDDNLRNQYENKIYTWAGVKAPQKQIEIKQQKRKKTNIVLDMLTLYSTNQSVLKDCFNINDYPTNTHNVIKVLRKEEDEAVLNEEERKLLDYVLKNPSIMDSENAIVNHYKYLLDFKNRR